MKEGNKTNSYYRIKNKEVARILRMIKENFELKQGFLHAY